MVESYHGRPTYHRCCGQVRGRGHTESQLYCWTFSSCSILSWHVNSKEVPMKYTFSYAPVLHPDGLETSTLELRLRLRKSHFSRGVIVLRCKATVAALYTRSDHDFLQLEGRKLQPIVLEQRDSQISGGVKHGSRCDQLAASGAAAATYATVDHLALMAKRHYIGKRATISHKPPQGYQLHNLSWIINNPTRATSLNPSSGLPSHQAFPPRATNPPNLPSQGYQPTKPSKGYFLPSGPLLANVSVNQLS
ncbi:hypothetical protein Hamer_G016951 [Homarus americanus]|uniref:Uncharacterized protein n=1 Tax=Homarus americanus TaxID=6706 RepID=A0A8J5TK12_HOMAM|nr:hypothetical protein Hamer_G016951 [Homarus americanus]